MSINYEDPKISDINEKILAVRDVTFPEYTTNDKSDFGIMLIWLFSVMYKFVIDHINRKHKNNFLSTAIDRSAIIENALGKGYRAKGTYAARQLLTFTATSAVTIPKGFQVRTSSGVIFETEQELNFSIEGTEIKSGQVYALQGESFNTSFISNGGAGSEYTVNNSPFVENEVEVTVPTVGIFQHYNDMILAGPTDLAFTYRADEDGKLILTFGDGINGVTIVEGLTIQVDYKIGAGISGNVETDTITELVNSLAGVSAVTNKIINNTTTALDYDPANGNMVVTDTKGFLDIGTAYVDGHSFTYANKTAIAFQGCSLDIPVIKGSIVSAAVTGNVTGINLESNSLIKYRAIAESRNYKGLISKEDYRVFVEKHPSVAWAYAYLSGNILQIVPVSVLGTILNATIKTSIANDIDKQNSPVLSYNLIDPIFIPIDIVVEIEVSGSNEYDNSVIISSDPLIYAGAKQNVTKVIENYLDPTSQDVAAKMKNGDAREVLIFDVMNMIHDTNQVKNIKIKNLSKKVLQTGLLTLTAGSKTITITGGSFSGADIGDTIKVVSSVPGNDVFVKIQTIVSATEITVDYQFTANESSIGWYYGSIKDITMTGNKIPTVGTVIVQNKFSYNTNFTNQSASSAITNISATLNSEM